MHQGGGSEVFELGAGGIVLSLLFWYCMLVMFSSYFCYVCICEMMDMNKYRILWRCRVKAVT